MPHPCVAATTQTIQHLRQAALSMPVAQGVHVTPHVYFSWDEENGGASISLRSKPGRLLTADVRVQGAPRWLTLCLDLGPGQFAEGQVLGLVIRGASSVGFDLAPFIRSRQDRATQDTPLQDMARLQPKPQTVVLLHDVLSQEPLTQASDHHALILPLPRQDVTLQLHDLRLFEVSGSEDSTLPRRTLTSVAY